MKNDIEQAIAACAICQADRPTQPRPIASGTNRGSVARPMDEIGTDLFDAIDRKWLATVDRYSGYAWLTSLTGTHTANITAELSNIFNSFGWPKSIRTDGGPQFRQEFANFCKLNSIQHELASAHNPNGLAEAAVKNLKAIVTRTHTEKANLEEAVAAWRNMARADRISPSQLFFIRLPHQKLPMHTDPTPISIDNQPRSITHKQSIASRNTHAQEIPSLPLGAQLWIRHHETKKWDRQAKIIEVRQDGRSYLLETANGTHLLQGRRFVKLC